MSPAYTDIIDSFEAKQYRTAHTQAGEFGWYDFVRELELDQKFDYQEKFKILCQLCRSHHRWD